MEVIKCPNCQRQLHVPEHYIGQKVQCPECRHTFLAATTAVSAQPQPQSAPNPPPPRVEPRRREYDDDDDGRAPRRRYEDDADEDDEFDPIRRRVGRGYAAPHRGAMILVFGVLSLTACGLLGPIAWILGHQDLAEMRAGRMDPSGEGLTRAGQVCGIIGTAFLALSALWIFFVIGMGFR